VRSLGDFDLDGHKRGRYATLSFMDLTNAAALVTGGSSGIGYGIAQELIQAGARVAITGRDKARLEKAAAELKAQAIHADSSKEPDAARAVQEAVAKLGGLDILVNNAGLGVFKPLVEMDLAGFERTFATNVTGAMLMGREAAKYFATRKRGNIVNIGSTASHRGAPNGTAYYASKFALRGMTECWRAELRKHNIRVFLVNPSEVLTNFGAAAGFEQKDNPTKLRPEDIGHAVRCVLAMDDRGFTTELTVFATNPQD
jgi:3-oxoacyl-[acyl-carrier protein] reductase